MMTRLPATFAEADMVDTVGHWVELVGEAMTAEAARTTLRNYIRGMLRRGTIPTMRVIAAAEAGHQDADMALRELGAMAEKDVLALLKERDVFLKKSAIQVLADIGTDASVPDLQQAAASGNIHLVEPARKALTAITDRKKQQGSR